MPRQIINTEKVPIKLWLTDIEEDAIKQAKNLANLPFTFKHVAIMPDSHIGYGMPIGGVLATKDVVIPNAVGVDIGCGMCSLKTNLKEIDKDILKKIRSTIGKQIPLGRNHHIERQDEILMPQVTETMTIIKREYKKALKQIGTLGGGNHFIEIQKGDEGFIYIMIHSGSRNLGKQVADYYNKIALQINKENNSEVPEKWELAYFEKGSEEYENYLSEMRFCVDFALANRKLMMENVKGIMTTMFPEIRFDNFINIAHNYASSEKHFGEDVIVHRKGATSAFQDELGVIPGSQGTKSYIVKGLGNPESFCSCSHGAGRVMGRMQARKMLDLDKEVEKMRQMGVIHGLRDAKDLDEAPGAYKDISVVMANQNDLVDIVTELSPMAVIKG